MYLKGYARQNWSVTTHFYTFGSNLRSIDGGGEGGGGEGRAKVYIYWKDLFTGSPKFSKSEPYELQEKNYYSRCLKYDATHQPQLDMAAPRIDSSLI